MEYEARPVLPDKIPFFVEAFELVGIGEFARGQKVDSRIVDRDDRVFVGERDPVGAGDGLFQYGALFRRNDAFVFDLQVLDHHGRPAVVSGQDLGVEKGQSVIACEE